jgi:hypothetical protein
MPANSKRVVAKLMATVSWWFILSGDKVIAVWPAGQFKLHDNMSGQPNCGRTCVQNAARTLEAETFSFSYLVA